MIADLEPTARWKESEATKYTHPIDIQLFADKPLLGLIGYVKDGYVADIGCGTGILSVQLAEKAGFVTGVDISESMVAQAQHVHSRDNVIYTVGSADALPIQDNSLKAAISSLTICNFDSRELIQGSFTEAHRVLVPGGRYVISSPHPLTLGERTKFRWTEWQENQSPETLIAGDGFTRKIMGADESMITITNYYWPPDVLRQMAEKAGLAFIESEEAIATKYGLEKYPQLEDIHTGVPFFLVMAFEKSKIS